MLLGENHLFELFHQVDTAEKVDFQDFLVHADIGVQGLLALRDARVEHEEVDAQAFFRHIIIESINGTVVVELGLGGIGFHTVLLAHLLGLVEVVDAQSCQHEVTAFLCQMQCDALPDACAASGDEGGFVFEL